MRELPLALGSLATLALGCVALGLSPADYHPKLDPANFGAAVDNPHYPLAPGTTYVFQERAPGETSVNEISVTHETKTVLGVPCVVVRDVVRRGGVAGAEPGILMPAHPLPGEPYRQQYRLGVAEDFARVVAIGESVSVPAGSFSDCVRTEEWSALEPGTDEKWYAPGVGLVRTESTAGEVAVLVSIRRD